MCDGQSVDQFATAQGSRRRIISSVLELKSQARRSLAWSLKAIGSQTHSLCRVVWKSKACRVMYDVLEQGKEQIKETDFQDIVIVQSRHN